MIRDSMNSVRLLIVETAKEYRDKGYDVSTEVPLDFLPGFCADLVVRKGGEAKVIEVKARSSVEADRRITELAEIIESKPGWTFQLIMVGEPENRDAPIGALALESEGMLQRIERAEKVLDSGPPEAAFILAWSACEAALRALVADEGISNPDITSTTYIINQARYLGLVSKDDYLNLTDLQKYRNAIVHGFTHDDLSVEMISELIQTARRMIAERDAEEYTPAFT